MINTDDISKIENKKKPPKPVQNVDNKADNRLKISCEHLRYKRCIPILVCIIIIPIAIAVPIVLIHKKKMTTNITMTTTKMMTTIMISTTVTTEIKDVQSKNNITNTTKWKQDGITIFQRSNIDESDPNFNSMYMTDNEVIYLTEINRHWIIVFQLNIDIFQALAGVNGDGDGTDQLAKPVGIVVDNKTDSIITCDSLNRRIVRWSRRDAANGDIIISNIFCNGVAMDNNGYLYVSDYLKNEVRQWEIGISNRSILVAGGNGDGNNLAQLRLPGSMFIDKDYSVYVVDTSNHRVMKWMKNATQGIIVAGGNNRGKNLTQLSDPLGVFMDHLGNVYVADTSNHRVMRWINGATEGSIIVGGNGPGNETNQLYSPSDLLFDKHGNLYVFDSVNYRIQKFEIESY